MKTYNVTNRISAQARAEIERIIETHNKYKGAYFFTPAGSASVRRRNEERFAENNPDTSFVRGEAIISVSMSYKESCKNVYYTLCVSVNGEKKNISAIKNLLKH